MADTVRLRVAHYMLEMSERPAAPEPHPRVEIRRTGRPVPSLNRFFYMAIGSNWLWASRVPWSHDQWREWVTQPGYSTWIGYVDGGPAGICDVIQHDPQTAEIRYFGLLPEFIGQGVGLPFLRLGIQAAWSEPTTTLVKVDTCSLDHPRALGNYQAAGFELVRTEHEIEEVPAAPLEPWPGSGIVPASGPADHPWAD